MPATAPKVLIGTGIREGLEETLSPDQLGQVKASCAPFLPGGARLDALDVQTLERVGGPPPRPEGDPDPLSADRRVLRSVLLRGLEANIEFGKNFVSYDITAEGITARFSSDGTEADGSLLVGADGARSTVRQQFLPDHGLLGMQGQLIYGKTPLTAQLEKKFDKGALGGMTMLCDTSRRDPLSAVLEAMRFDVREGESRAEKGLPEDYVHWVLGWRKDVLGMSDRDLLHLSHEEAAALSQKLTSTWHPSLRVLFALQDASQTSALSILSVHPDIPKWTPSNRVTLIGDAVHIMSPTAGIGATTALRDAALLVKTLVEKGMGVDAIRGFEREMREYAGQAVRMSHGGGKVLYDMRPFDEMKPATE